MGGFGQAALMAAPTLYQILNPADSPSGIAQSQAPTQGSTMLPQMMPMQGGAGQPDPMTLLLAIMSQLGSQPGVFGQSSNQTGGP